MSEETTVVVEGGNDGDAAPAEALTDASAVAVATAGAAAALATETAAHAELQAAEEIQEVAEEADAWRTATAASLADLAAENANLSTRLNEMHSREEERNSQQTALLERLLALEEAELSRQSTLAPSDEVPETVEERTEEAPIVGAETTAQLGPAEAEISGGISSDSTEKRAPPNPNANARPRVLRRWI